MGLHIVVCVKRTPASTSVALDSETGTVKTEGIPHAINPLDEYAIEEALRIKEKVNDSKVTVLTLGPDDAESVVRAALALGCDAGVLLSDPSFTGSDTYANSYLLAQGIKKIGEKSGQVHLVLFGKQTNDGESGHTTAEVGAWLGWPSAIYVKKIPEVTDLSVTVERAMEDGIDTLKLKTPAVVSVSKEINEPRLPSLKGKMKAKKTPIEKWTAADIAADSGKTGKEGSPTEVLNLSAIPSRPSGAVIPGETAEDKARTLIEKLKEQKFI